MKLLWQPRDAPLSADAAVAEGPAAARLIARLLGLPARPPSELRVPPVRSRDPQDVGSAGEGRKPKPTSESGRQPERLLDESLARTLRAAPSLPWLGVAAPDLLLIIGPDLPWVDGIRYLAKRDALYVPTNLAPNVPLPLLERALAAKCKLPCAVFPHRIISLDAARTIDRARLEALS